MLKEQVPVDLVTLVDALDSSGELENIGGAATVASLIDGVHRSPNIDQYAAIVRRKSAERQVAKKFAELAEIVASGGQDLRDIITETTECLKQFAIDLDTSKRAGVQSWTENLSLSNIPDTPVAWLVEGLLPYGGIALIASEAGKGKTWLAMDMCKAVASGKPFLGRATRHTKVLYLDHENLLSSGGSGWLN